MGALLTPGRADAALAYPMVANFRTQLLTEYPTETMPTSTVSRSIYLISGTYMWTVDIGTPRECDPIWDCPTKASGSIWLIEGTYAWNCYLDPHKDEYVEWCTLKRDDYPEEARGAPAFKLRASGVRRPASGDRRPATGPGADPSPD